MARDSLGDLDPFQTVQPDVKRRLEARPDLHEPTLDELFLAAVQAQHAHFPPVRRTARDIRRTCRFCRGQGCLNCDTLVEEEYARQFPTDQPVALLTFRLDDPEEMRLMQETLGAAVLDQLPADPEQALRALLTRIAETVQIQQHLSEAPREEV